MLRPFRNVQESELGFSSHGTLRKNVGILEGLSGFPLMIIASFILRDCSITVSA